MSLDAFVNCNCVRDRKVKKPPAPFTLEDLYYDEDGYLWSKLLDEEYDQWGFSAKFDRLDNAFRQWMATACEHEDCRYVDEWVSNIAGVAQFRSLVDELGGEKRYPLLSNFLPKANDGMYPAALAEPTLAELDAFIKEVSALKMWGLMYEDPDAPLEEVSKPCWTSTPTGGFTWVYGDGVKVSMEGPWIVFRTPYIEVKTQEFRQDYLGEPSEGNQKVLITCHDCGLSIELFGVIGSRGSGANGREFWIEECEAPFLYEGKYPTAERLRTLLAASVETGNPIVWC